MSPAEPYAGFVLTERCFSGGTAASQTPVSSETSVTIADMIGSDPRFLQDFAISGPQTHILRAADENLASEFHIRLVKWITEYDAGLDAAHEVGVRLVSFGQEVTFRLHDLDYWNPSLMKFIGVLNNGTPVELIQHVSQISILLMTLPLLDPSQPKRPIGFSMESAKNGR